MEGSGSPLDYLEDKTKQAPGCLGNGRKKRLFGSKVFLCVCLDYACYQPSIFISVYLGWSTSQIPTPRSSDVREGKEGVRWEFPRLPTEDDEGRQIPGTGLHHRLQTHRTIWNIVKLQNKIGTTLRWHFVDKQGYVKSSWKMEFKHKCRLVQTFLTSGVVFHSVHFP